MMREEELLSAAFALGFADAAVVDTSEIVFQPAFRVCCEDNLCGKYGVNYTCPPACGTTEEMRGRILRCRRALVLQSMWDADDPMDSAQTAPAKRQHNQWTRALLEQSGLKGLMVGASGCSLCTPCMLERGAPCRFPDRCWSCMSAYCIYVQKLAERCGMDYDCGPGCVALFSLLCFGARD
ncbi:MAG: DUF2284 domain-containing protein [Oscillospiraceae bacterium]|nr:DUF2284 domain-containing protein [Oscillospiraceae bacterium]